MDFSFNSVEIIPDLKAHRYGERNQTEELAKSGRAKRHRPYGKAKRIRTYR